MNNPRKGLPLLVCRCPDQVRTPLILAPIVIKWNRPEIANTIRWNPRIVNFRRTFQTGGRETAEHDFAGNAEDLAGYLQISGECPKCRAAFEIRSLFDEQKMLDLLDRPNSGEPPLRICKGNVEICASSQTLLPDNVSVDWIPSRRGPARLHLTTKWRGTFALCATMAIRLGLPYSDYPDWYPVADDVLFDGWSLELLHTVTGFRSRLAKKFSGDIKAEREFFQKRLVALTPEIQRHCRECTAVIEGALT